MLTLAMKSPRSLAACEGVILIVDATQGVQAQTLANLYLAMENDLVIIPVINKIDLPSADIDLTRKLIKEVLGLDAPGDDAIPVSAKTGENVEEVLEAIIEKIPPPSGDKNAKLQALIYDSYYDSYAGAIMKVCVVNGKVSEGDKITLMQANKDFVVNKLGINMLKNIGKKSLSAGEVGYIIANIKAVENTRVGDTVTLKSDPALETLPGYKEVKPMVFSGLFPIDGADFSILDDAIHKLKLNDASLVFEQENSPVLGFGFRVGYLGLLHMEIVKERLVREFQLDLISTPPSVSYKVTNKKGKVLFINNPSLWPNPTEIDRMEEPLAKVSIITPTEYLGALIKLLQEKRAAQENIIYLHQEQVQLLYKIPLAEFIYEFYDKLKSISHGYATLDYELIGFREAKLARIDILINGDPVDALTFILERSNAEKRGRGVIEKLKDLIPKTPICYSTAGSNRIKGYRS